MNQACDFTVRLGKLVVHLIAQEEDSQRGGLLTAEIWHAEQLLEMDIETFHPDTGLDQEQRVNAVLSVILLAFALPSILSILSRLWDDRKSTHALHLAMGWLIMADLMMVANYLPHHMITLIKDTFVTGWYCQISGFVSLMAVVWSNIAAVGVAYVTHTTMMLKSKSFGQRFRDNFWKWTVALILPSFLYAIILSSTKQIGEYRGLYCCLSDWSHPLTFWFTAFIFVSSATAQGYYYYQSYSYVKAQFYAQAQQNAQQGDGGVVPGKHLVEGIRLHAIRMCCTFYLAWVPMLLVGLMAYIHGGVVTEEGEAFPRAFDIFSVVCVKLVPSLDCLILNRSLRRAEINRLAKRGVPTARLASPNKLKKSALPMSPSQRSNNDTADMGALNAPHGAKQSVPSNGSHHDSSNGVNDESDSDFSNAPKTEIIFQVEDNEDEHLVTCVSGTGNPVVASRLMSSVTKPRAMAPAESMQLSSQIREQETTKPVKKPTSPKEVGNDWLLPGGGSRAGSRASRQSSANQPDPVEVENLQDDDGNEDGLVSAEQNPAGTHMRNSSVVHVVKNRSRKTTPSSQTRRLDRDAIEERSKNNVNHNRGSSMSISWGPNEQLPIRKRSASADVKSHGSTTPVFNTPALTIAEESLRQLPDLSSSQLPDAESLRQLPDLSSPQLPDAQVSDTSVASTLPDNALDHNNDRSDSEDSSGSAQKRSPDASPVKAPRDSSKPMLETAGDSPVKQRAKQTSHIPHNSMYFMGEQV